MGQLGAFRPAVGIGNGRLQGLQAVFQLGKHLVHDLVEGFGNVRPQPRPQDVVARCDCSPIVRGCRRSPRPRPRSPGRFCDWSGGPVAGRDFCNSSCCCGESSSRGSASSPGSAPSNRADVILRGRRGRRPGRRRSSRTTGEQRIFTDGQPPTGRWPRFAPCPGAVPSLSLRPRRPAAAISCPPCRCRRSGRTGLQQRRRASG